jgi:hypothetical protein
MQKTGIKDVAKREVFFNPATSNSQWKNNLNSHYLIHRVSS